MGIKICLDAGHFGKYNRSPVVSEYYESDMNWKLHLLLKAELERYGFEVFVTRQDKEKDLNEYYRGTASAGADLFLSLHSNAAERESADHPVVYVPLNGSGHKLGTLLATCIRNTMDTDEPAQVRTREGKNGDYYGVIRGATAVGVTGLILEHSFHTNTRATKWLMDDGNLATMAKAEAEVIAAWFGITKPEEKPAEEPERWYRIRERWDNPQSQVGAYKDLEKAKTACPEGYTIYDCYGQAVYVNVPKPATYTLELPILRKGDAGETVRAMQSLLMLRGVELPRYGADGDYGAETVAGVVRFQTQNALAADGVVGPETAKKLLGVTT